MSKIRYAAPAERLSQVQDRCFCVAPGLITHAQLSTHEASEGYEDVIPLAPALNAELQPALASHFPRATALSLLLLHITQFEYTQRPGEAGIHKRVNHHAPASFLEQVIHATRRVLRASDLLLIDQNGSGAAFLFPQVDRVGIAQITERVHRSIDLFQAETVVPPLREQTEIVLGAASYPELAASPEELLIQASQVRERIVFRPAVLPEPIALYPRTPDIRDSTQHTTTQGEQTRATDAQGIPFMQIPSRLPTRLKQLIPHPLAAELRCAPVGRDHNRLTVAMANPADTQAIDQLREVTGMTIFPVSCELSALESLLASNW